jgi:predicted ribosome quality control (RQC) complex YloA/Tae2 family protein
VKLATIKAIGAELEGALSGNRFGKVFQLSRFETAIDFRLHDSAYLFISIEPAAPRIYLIKRRLRDLERGSGNLSPFMLYLRKRLSGAEAVTVEPVEKERVLVVEFSGETELGEHCRSSLVVQLTGRSANLFLLDENKMILESARETQGEGQRIGDIYSPPGRAREKVSTPAEDEPFGTRYTTLSQALDEYYLERESERDFKSLAGSAAAKLRQEIAKREKLAARLRSDLQAHGDAEKWKRFGDLLLANISTATRDGDSVIVIDYFDENTPQLRIEVDRNDSITEAANKSFKRYTKARNAGEEIAKRLSNLGVELQSLTEQKERLETAIAEKDEDFLNQFLGRKDEPAQRRERKPPETNTGVRHFTSSDGFEILVGKKAKDNDFLTFRMAKSLDLWMHAADYPGSHVVVRNPNRKDIPHQTLLEAAQLAAFYSQGKQQPKAAVHYTQKKFVNKPRGASPGLVSLASFKTILVEPKVPDF